MTAEFTEEFVQVGESRIRLLKGGSGESLLIFHFELSCPGGTPPADENGFLPGMWFDKLTANGGCPVRPEPVEGRTGYFQSRWGRSRSRTSLVSRTGQKFILLPKNLSITGQS